MREVFLPINLPPVERIKKNIWVIGPGGSGKTTLVSSYIKKRKLPCLWFQIDAGDSDLATFFTISAWSAKRVPFKNVMRKNR